MAELYILSQDDKLLTVLSEDTGLEGAPFREELNQGSSFSFTVDATEEGAAHVVEENQVVFRDKEGDLRLFVIKEIDDLDNSEGAKTTAICEPAFMELKEHIVVDRRFVDKQAREALDASLEGTRWTGQVEVELGEATTNFYYIPSVDAIWKIREVWGGEFKDVVEFDGNQIIARIIKIVQRRGMDTGKRFEIDHDIEEIERTVLSYPVTAIYGRGASLEVEDEEGNLTGGYTRFIDFADVVWSKANGDPVDKPKGQRWVGDPEALLKYGRLHNGQLLHREATWENGDYEDPAELLRATWEHLQEVKEPEINYRLSVYLLEQIAGYEHEKVSLGDTCFAIDRRFSRPIEIQARVIAIEYDILDIENTGVVEMGQLISAYSYDNRIDKIAELIQDNRGRWESKPKINDVIPDLIPGIPVNVTATGGFKVIQLHWEYDSKVHVSHYEVYGSQVKDFIPQSQHLLYKGKVSAFSHQAEVDQVWYYRVRAVNTYGRASAYSTQVSASTVRVISDDILFSEEIAAKLRELSETAGILADGSVDLEKIKQDAIDNIQAGAKKYTDDEILAAEQAIQTEINNRIGNVNNEITALQNQAAVLESDLLDKVDQTVYDTKINQIVTDISKKVDQTAYETKINQLAADISDKVDQSAHDSQISQIVSDISEKVDQAAYNIKLTEIASDISKKVDQTAYDTKISQIASDISKKVDSGVYTQKVNELTNDIAEKAGLEYVDSQLVLKANQADLDSLSIGGRNLLRNSKGGFVLLPKNTGASSDNYNYYRFYCAMELNQEYTISADIEITAGDFTKVSIYAYPGGTASAITIPPNGRVTYTFTKTKEEIDSVLIYAGPSGSTMGNGIIIRNVKIEKGNRATDYTPAFEDVFDSIEVKADKSTTYTKTEVDNALDSKVSNVIYTADMDGIITDLESQESRISQTEQGLTSKVESSVYSQKVTDLESSINKKSDKTYVDTELGKKADTSKVTALETRMTSAETSLEQTSTEIALKANKDDVYTKTETDGKITTIDNRLKSAETAITANADEIELRARSTDVYTKTQVNTELNKKADNSTVTALTTRVSSAESQLSVQAGQISAKAEKADVYTKTETDGKISSAVNTAKAEIKLTTDGITSEVTRIEGKVDGLQVGGRNLLLGTSNEFEVYDKVGSWGDHFPYDDVSVNEGETLTARAYLKASPTNNKRTSIRIRLYDSGSGWTDFFPDRWLNPGEEGYCTITLTVPAGYVRLRFFAVRFDTNVSERSIVEYKEAKLEKGNRATDYTPAPEDIDSAISDVQSFASSVDQKADSIQSSVTSLSSTVSGHGARLSDAETTISQHSTSISLKANASDVYTKNEADGKINTAVNNAKSEIKITTDGIFSDVSRVEGKIDGLQVGGRNLLGGTSRQYKNLTPGTFYAAISEGPARALDVYDLKAGDTVTFRVYINAPNTYGGRARITTWRADNTYTAVTGNLVAGGSEGYSTVTYTIPDDRVSIQFGIQNQNSGGTSSVLQYKEAKAEKGSIATDYTPSIGDVDNAISDVQTFASSVDQKADSIQSSVSSLTQTVNSQGTRLSNAETIISQHTNSINLKADKTDVYTKTEADGKINTAVNSAKAEIQLTTDGISSDVSRVEGKVDGLEIGGRNLIPNSNDFSNYTGYQGTQREIETNVSVPEWETNKATRLKFQRDTETIQLYTTPQIYAKKSSTVTFSYWIKNIGEKTLNVRYNGLTTIKGSASENIPPGTQKRIIFTGIMRDDYDWFQHQFRPIEVGDEIEFIIWRSQLEYGTTATDWTPAPEDVDKSISNVQSFASSVDQKADSINQSVTILTSTVNSHGTRLSSAESAINQNADEIALRVTKTEFDNLKIGGRNLVRGSLSALTTRTIGQFGASSLLNVPIDGELVSHGDDVTFSIYIQDIPEGEAVSLRLDWYRDNGTYSNVMSSEIHSENGRYSFTAKVPNDKTFSIIRGRIFPRNWTSNYQIKTKEEKLEVGTKATEWTPSPEDVDSNITKSVSDAKAEIKVTTDSISQSVTSLNSTVNSHGTRLTSAESEISQNANEIALRVTKGEFDNLQIGGTNLLVNSSFENGNSRWTTTTTVVAGYGTSLGLQISRSNYDGSSRIFATQVNYNDADKVLMAGETYTISGWFYIDSSVPFTSNSSSFFVRKYEYMGTNMHDLINIPIRPANYEPDKWHFFKGTGTVREGYTGHEHIGFGLGQNGKVIISRIKIEKGDKATDWTPSPKDIDNNITKSVSDAKAEIKVTTDSISQSVSSLTSTVSSHGTRISSTESSITTLNDTVSIKANASDVYTKTQVNTELGKKVDTTVYNNKMSSLDTSISGISGRVTNTETSINDLTGEINSAQSQIAAVDLKADGISTSVSELKSNSASADDFRISLTTISTSGWYRIASNAGNRAFARFIIKDTYSGKHSTAVFNAGINYGKNPNLTLLGFSRYGSQAFTKARIIYQSTYDPPYLEIYVQAPASLEVWCLENVQSTGWNKVNFTAGEIPAGYVAKEYDINESNIVDVTSENTSKDTSNVNGVPSTQITSRLSAAETSITQNATEIALKASQSSLDSLTGRMSSAESTLTVQAGQIASKVEKDGIISAINQTPESVKIQAKLIDLVGDVYITNGQTKITNLAVGTAALANAAVTNAKIANLAVSTAQIQDAAITNAKIHSVSADKINAGAIRGIDIYGSQFRSSDGNTRLHIVGGNIRLTQSTGNYVETNPNGVFGYNSNGSQRFRMDSLLVTSAALGTSNSNVYLAPDASNEARIVNVNSIPSDGAPENYSYRPLRALGYRFAPNANGYIGTDLEVRITSSGFTQSDGSVVYRNLRSNGLYANFLEAHGENIRNLYLRAHVDGEVQVTTQGSTTSFNDIRARWMIGSRFRLSGSYATSILHVQPAADGEVRITSRSDESAYRPIRARDFITDTSMRENKKHIEIYNENVLDVFRNANIYTYRRKNDDSGAKLQLGMMLDEIPSITHSESGDSFAMYALTSYTAKGLKDLIAVTDNHSDIIQDLIIKNAILENRLAALEQKLEVA